MSASAKSVMFKVGQKVIRKTGLTSFQKENWERWARRKGIDPYGPVEIVEVEDLTGDLYIKECGLGSRWKASNFIPVLIEKELEDYM